MPSLATYAVRKLAAAFPVLFVVSLVVFVIMHVVPGDPTAAMVGNENMDSEVRDRLIVEFGLDRPLPIQYLAWLSQSARGNLGVSFGTREPVADILVERLTVTFHLAVLALLVGVVVAVPLGLVAASKRNSMIDIVLSLFATIGIAIPSFFTAILLIYFVSVKLDLLPPSGFVRIWDDPVQSVRLLVLPVTALSMFLIASLMRQTRSAALEIMRQDYVRTAHAKGLASRVVLYRHVLRNALLPVVTILGLQAAHVLAGSIIIETMFAIPGFGRLAVDSIRTNDTPTLQAVVLVMATLVILMNVAIDIAYTIIDPRIRRT